MNRPKPSAGQESDRVNQRVKGNAGNPLAPSNGQPARPGVAPGEGKLASPTTWAGRRLDVLGANEALNRAHEYANLIVEAVPPLLVLDPDLRVVTANESFYKHFRVAPLQTENCL